jgi:hypothetical protein
VFDMAARYGEEELQESESTPDVRLHYPEPFIASPSFVHEEIWFIHILHYQQLTMIYVYFQLCFIS